MAVAFKKLGLGRGVSGRYFWTVVDFCLLACAERRLFWILRKLVVDNALREMKREQKQLRFRMIFQHPFKVMS